MAHLTAPYFDGATLDPCRLARQVNKVGSYSSHDLVSLLLVLRSPPQAANAKPKAGENTGMRRVATQPFVPARQAGRGHKIRTNRSWAVGRRLGLLETGSEVATRWLATAHHDSRPRPTLRDDGH